MSRSGYSDVEQWALIRWRGAVASAIRGRRGQEFLREMLAAMDSLPRPRLIANSLESDGEVCAIGSVGRARGLPMQELDPYDREQVAQVFGIAEALAAEIAYVNDEWPVRPETPEERFLRVRGWIVGELREEESR